MAVTHRTLTSVAAGAKPRLPGPDVVRAFALIGVVVMNYHGYLIIDGGDRGDGWAAELFDPWTGPMSTRFAATFVLVAGVGVTLMTNRCRASGRGITEMRWRLVRRGALLYVGGLLLDELWPGTIIPYYGAMFVIAAALFTLRSRWIAMIGTAAALAGWAIRWWRLDRQQAGHSTSWLTDPDAGTVQGFVYDVFLNGTHPLLPWLVFLCAGMLLARAFGTAWWRTSALVAGGGLALGAAMIRATASSPWQRTILSTHPGDRGVVYVASALGTALVAYAVLDWLADTAGALTATLLLAWLSRRLLRKSVQPATG